jgi:hypothetical protein
MQHELAVGVQALDFDRVCWRIVTRADVPPLLADSPGIGRSAFACFCDAAL